MIAIKSSTRASMLSSLPANLLKAAEDRHWTYLIGLKTGVMFVCEGVTISANGEWATLNGAKPVNLPAVVNIGSDTFIFGRSVDVRVSDIAWIGDCDS